MPDPTTPLDLEAIRERVEAATPPPWTAGDDGLVWSERAGDPVSGSTELADAEFIAHARTDVPALLAALAEAQRERDEARQHILDIDAHATPYGDIPDEPGWVGTYLLTAGALHRALGKIGHSAPKCQAEHDLKLTQQAIADEYKPGPSRG